MRELSREVWDELVQTSRELDARDVVRELALRKDRERHKWGCPACGSSDALHVYSGSGRGAYCWSCADSLDAIDLVHSALGLDFKEAVHWLADTFGYASITTEADMKRSRDARQRREIEREARRAAQLAQKERQRVVARDVWERVWRATELGPRGRTYLAGRGFDLDMVCHVGIRSVESDEEWAQVCSQFWPDDLETAGLTGTNNRGAFPVPWRTPFLIIPYWLVDRDGIDIIRFRLLEGEPKYISPLGWKPTVPYLASGSYRTKTDLTTLYVLEGELNALSVLQAGALAIGSCGSGMWLDEWAKDFQWFQKVVVLPDKDDAGLRFAQRVGLSVVAVMGRDWFDRHVRMRSLRDGDANDALRSGALEGVVSGG